jgi:hypothetical protein
MRAIVLALAMLAGLKVWYQDTVYRTAATEALVSAYRTRATEACQKQPQRDELGRSLAAFQVDWRSPTSIEVVIGNKQVDVSLWETDHPLWAARYKHPYLMLASGDRHSRLSCAYDVLAGSATLVRG